MDNTGSGPDPAFPGDHHRPVIQPVGAESDTTSGRGRRGDQRRALKPPLGMVAASVFGIASAILYTLANIALRRCVGVDPFLVTAMKAVPTVVFLGPFVGWMLIRGDTIATSFKMVPRFMAASFVAQFVGNASFQVALGVIGLAASVPITLGVLIIGGAILGRVILHEPVRPRTVLAMITLIAAVVVLSLPGATESPSQSTTTYPVWVGALFAAASGAAYALFGVAMRQTLNGGMSAPATMLISGLVGTIALSATVWLRLGIGPLRLITPEQWGVMFAAGTFNFGAFVSISLALKSLPVVAVNLINASQVAMAGVAGVILFAEPVTAPLVVGILLTFAGLMILANRGRTTRRVS